MKEELLNIAMQSLSDDDVKEIVKDKFKKMIERAVEDAFKWGDAEKAIKRKVTEVMVPYIEKYDFSEYLPKLDSVLTEIVNSDACMGNKTILENFRDLMIEPEQKEIKVTDLFKIWKKRCEKEIDTGFPAVIRPNGSITAAEHNRSYAQSITPELFSKIIPIGFTSRIITEPDSPVPIITGRAGITNKFKKTEYGGISK